jgi:hypothetical protein
MIHTIQQLSGQTLSMKSTGNRAPASELLSRFAAIVAEKYAVTDPAVLAPFLVEGRGLYQGRSAMLLRPGSVGAR